MRLLKLDEHGALSITKDLQDSPPPYAILSHTWGDDEEEVTFDDVTEGLGKSKAGYAKLQFCGQQAKKDGLEYFWVDTCCINKSSSSALAEAIVSMFKWYSRAAKCYVFLSDVSARKRSHTDDEQMWASTFRKSRWFMRGWTLQELLAPRQVEFYSRDEERLGDKSTLEQEIHEITTIPIEALRGAPLSNFTIDERMRWALYRNTKRTEDKAYCLLGILEVYMCPLYGEEENALNRLKKEIESPSMANKRNEVFDFRESVGLCLGHAPYIDPSLFIGRQSELDQMSTILEPSSESQERRQLVLGGKGGIGKTQLAIAYANRHRNDYTSVFWLNAGSEATLNESFQLIAGRIFDVQESGLLEGKQIINQIHRWLSDQRNTQWLLIFDNHDDASQFKIESYYPLASHGAIVITTRRPDLIAGKAIRIEPLKRIDESLAILETRSNRQETKTDLHAALLAERLGGLPLALATAGAYLCTSSFTFERYLQEYNKRWNVDPRRPQQLQEYQDRTLYTTWNLSYNRLEREDPDAANLLRLLAYFDNQSFWYELFRAELVDDLSKCLRGLIADETNFTSVMKTLTDFCFVEVKTTASWSMHNCVHDWTLASLNEVINKEQYLYAFDCVAASIDWDDRLSFGNVIYGRFAAHAARLVHDRFRQCQFIEDLSPRRLGDALCIAQLLMSQIQLDAAERMYVAAMAGSEKVLGLDDKLTLHIISNLGVLFRRQSKLKEAEQMLKRALDGRKRTLGSKHTLTLQSVNNLGILYRDQGKFVEAEEMFQKALAESEEAMDTVDILTLVNNLGVLYWNQGKLEEAEQTLNRALAGRERVLGLDHTLTLHTVHNVGNVHRAQGKLVEAEKMYSRARTGRENTLGPDHQLTLDTVNNQGNLYADQGKLAEAEQMYLRALAGREKASQSNTISSLNTIENLGLLYRDQGKIQDAENKFRQAALGRIKLLGSDHPETLRAIKDLKQLENEVSKIENQNTGTSQTTTRTRRIDCD